MNEVSNGKERKCRSGDAFGMKCRQRRTADKKLKNTTVM